MAIYGEVTHVGNGTNVYTAKAGCVMFVTDVQVGYLLGRDLMWDNALGELKDGTTGGLVMDASNWEPLTW